ncbi:MAG: transcription-repair coupling factor, partial [Actinomycetes bacterium]
MTLLSSFPNLPITAPFAGGELIAINSLRSYVLAKLSQDSPLLVIAPSTRIADELCDEIRSLIGDYVINFPAWETLPHERLSPKSDTVTTRIKVLHQINSSHPPKVIITSIRGALQPIVADILDEEVIHLALNKEMAMSKLIERLSYFGFTRTDLVEKRGDFAVRGGILDLFPSDHEHPIRLDFFGDAIEDIQYFQVADQRTYAAIVSDVIIYPGRELLISDDVKAKASYLAAEFPQLTEMASKIAEGICVEGMESIAALLKPNFKNLIEFLPESSQVVIIDQPRIKSRAADLVTTNKEFLEASWSSAAFGNAAPIDLTGVISSGGYSTFDEVLAKIAYSKLNWFALNPYTQSPDDLASAKELTDFAAIPIY